MGRGVKPTPRPLYLPGKRLYTPCTGGWVGPMDSPDGAEYLSPSVFDPRTVQSVAVRFTTTLSGPTQNCYVRFVCIV